MSKAFSLIELLISLIVISVIVSAFAPVMTKKLQHGKISISQSNKKLSSNCTTIHENCRLCYDGDTNCLLCLATCGSGEYVDNVDCNCKNCSAKFANCSLCTQTKCTRCTGGYGINSGVCTKCNAGQFSDGSTVCKSCSGAKEYSSAGANSCSTCGTGQKANSTHTGCVGITCGGDEYLSGDNCIKCSNTYANCAKCNASVCTECNSDSRLVLGTCKAMVKPKQSSDCAQFNGAIFAKINSDGTGICVTKHNVGDPDGPTNSYSTITLVTAGTASSITPCPSGAACCWSGAQTTMTTPSNTDDATYCYEGGIGNISYSKANGTKFDYKSCKRTVCNRPAGKIACGKYKTEKTQEGDWRLPTDAEMGSIGSLISSEPHRNVCGSGNTFDANNSKGIIQKYMGAYGLQLCENYTGSHGSPKCRYAAKRCKGSSNWSDIQEPCVPSCVISSGSNGFYCLSDGYFRNSLTKETNCDINDNMYPANKDTASGSVRCVLDKYPE